VKLTDAALLAIESLTLHRLRTGLSAVAVGIGVTAVLVLAGLGDAVKRYVVEQFAAMGSNLVMIMPGKTETSGAVMVGTWGDRDLTLEDADAIRRRVPGLSAVVPMSLGSAAFRYAERRRDVYVIGVTSDYEAMRELTVRRGEFLPSGDLRAGGSVVVIGTKLAREVFGNEDPVGRMVRIAERRFRVVGVLGPKGQSLGYDFDELALVPVATGMRMFDQSSLYRILVQASDAAALPRVIAATREVVMDRHRAEDFTIVSQDAMLRSFRSILDALTAAVAGIAAISVAVAGIGIMNIMLIAVSERVAEVGLLKALGANRGEITRLFLLEAMFLSGWGGALGITLGIGAILAVAHARPDFPLEPSGPWTLAIFVVALTVGGVFGLLPARRAAGLAAAEALRGKR
jgi:putative ABC transport system permease protein